MNTYIYSVDIDIYRNDCTDRVQIEIKATDKLDAIRKVINTYGCNYQIVKLWGIDKIR